MAARPSLDGLYPNCFERSSGVITFGADGDSFYEYADLLLAFEAVSAGVLLGWRGANLCRYLLKAYLQGGKQEPMLWKMYNDAVDGMEKWCVTMNHALAVRGLSEQSVCCAASRQVGAQGSRGSDVLVKCPMVGRPVGHPRPCYGTLVLLCGGLVGVGIEASDRCWAGAAAHEACRRHC